MKKLFFVVLMLVPTLVFATTHPEKFYQDKICEDMGGKTEVVTQTGTRCDCLTDEYAIEFDFAHKWAESVGQSLDYAAHFQKKAGIVLIMEGEAVDVEQLSELLWLIREKKLDITVWATNVLGAYSKVN